jgi:hypothetical protein
MVDSRLVPVCAILVVLAVVVVGWNAWRTRAARRRLEQVYAAAHHPYRRLVEVLRLRRCSRAGQLLLVIDVRTGEEGAVWLPFHALRPGELALLAWMDSHWVLMERIGRAGARRASRPRQGQPLAGGSQLVNGSPVVRAASRILRMQAA